MIFKIALGIVLGLAAWEALPLIAGKIYDGFAALDHWIIEQTTFRRRTR